MNLNGKQIILLVCGLFFLIAIACLSTWALVGGSSNQLDESGSTASLLIILFQTIQFYFFLIKLFAGGKISRSYKPSSTT